MSMSQRREAITEIIATLARLALEPENTEPENTEWQEVEEPENTEWQEVEMRQQHIGDTRHYCVWYVPKGTSKCGPGLYTGPHPAVWRAILTQGRTPDKDVLCGSGICLKRYSSLEKAREAWERDCPSCYRQSLQCPPPVRQILE